MADELTDDELKDLLADEAKKGSGSSSSGGGGAPAATIQDYTESQYKGQLASIYVGLWGVPAPPGYLEGVARSGMNIYEFEAHERAKPSFKHSSRYAEEKLGIGLQLAQQFGALG